MSDRSKTSTRPLAKRIKKLGRKARAGAERAERQVRELADDAVVLGVGARAYALDKVGKAARDAIDAPSQQKGPRAAKSASGDARPYPERTKQELYELAQERDIEGRSSMTKHELIEALRD